VKRIALIALITPVIILILSALASAQTISPLNSEHNRKKVRGEFSLTNDGFAPLAVTLEPMSLTFVDGKPVVSDLAPTARVKLSEYSASIGVKQIRTFMVNASCDDDCAFIVFATMMTGHTNTGVAIATHVGSTFYACQRAKGCRASFLAQLKTQ